MQIQVPPTTEQQTKVYNCKACDIPLALDTSHVAKHIKWQARDGPGLLFTEAKNIQTTPPFEMAMTTGPHMVRDVSCVKCDKVVGWLYVKAPCDSEQYKVGTYMLEKELMSEGVMDQQRSDSHL